MYKHLAAPIILLGLSTSSLLGPPAHSSPGTSPLATQCFARGFNSRVQSSLRGYADLVGIPGISFGVVVKDSLVYAGGIGYANKRSGTPADANTPYRVASVTKVFTAALAEELAAEGLLDLDAPVSRYLPDSVRVPQDSLGHGITARHLITHSARLPKNPPNRRNQRPAGPIDPGVWEAYNVADLYQALGTTRLAGVLGTTMEYSNYGYGLLGHVVERVAGAPYEEVLRARLLTPLRMTESGITMTPAQDRRRAADYWEDDDERVEQHVQARFGEVAGFIGLTSTVRDLARFLTAYLGAPVEGRPVVPVAVVQAMAEPQLYVETFAGRRYDMALGWFRRTAADSSSANPLLWHTGELDGHSAGIFLRPQEGLGVIVLQNLGGELGGRSIERIGDWLLRLAEHEQARCQR